MDCIYTRIPYNAKVRVGLVLGAEIDADESGNLVYVVRNQRHPTSTPHSSNPFLAWV